MRAMTKRERVLAAVARRAVDRPPVAFWRHAPDVDHTAEGLAEAMLAFHRRRDLALIKVMPCGADCAGAGRGRVASLRSRTAATQRRRPAARAARWAVPSAARRVGAFHGASAFTLLHVRGKDVYFDAAAGLPAHAVNWHDRRTAPTLAEAKRRRPSGALVGGLGEATTLKRGPVTAITAEVTDALAQTDGVGVILGPGCVLPLD